MEFWRGSRKRLGLKSGAERSRTVDLLNAIQALSQLSYSPTAMLHGLANTRIPLPETTHGGNSYVSSEHIRRESRAAVSTPLCSACALRY